MEPPVVSLLIALEENLQSSRLLRETLGCASGAGGPRRGGPTCPLRWRRPPVLEASEGARSNNHTCAHTAYITVCPPGRLRQPQKHHTGICPPSASLTNARRRLDWRAYAMYHLRCVNMHTHHACGPGAGRSV